MEVNRGFGVGANHILKAGGKEMDCASLCDGVIGGGSNLVVGNILKSGEDNSVMDMRRRTKSSSVIGVDPDSFSMAELINSRRPTSMSKVSPGKIRVLFNMERRCARYGRRLVITMR